MTYLNALMVTAAPSIIPKDSAIGSEIIVALIGILGIIIGGLFSKTIQAQFEKRKWKENIYNEYWQCFSRATMQGKTVEDLQAYAVAYSRLLLIASKKTVRAVYEIKHYLNNPNPNIDMNTELQNKLYRAMRSDLVGWWRFPNLRIPKLMAATVSVKTDIEKAR